ncbi:Spx/MgsR family RNA polymerase-binding regulatory protein [Echinicola sp. CAU 1574]|uniref:Spx/MgsR family RNA polymerase-binding regulatory protein n=2 Tax=Echinicola arenosa TaxID=2774144 RepID=A0ABR9AQY8_9BACT|nr:Spx/MgsR family RNA polymerase-binding regulatory protein [Echinicola arenosa]
MVDKLMVYGIKNCDTMKKTFKLLEEQNVDYDFVDYKKQAPSEDLLKSFLKKIPLDILVNKRGTTYRKLSEEDKSQLEAVSSALQLLIENSSMIKRPVMVYPDGEVLVGFQKDRIVEKK